MQRLKEHVNLQLRFEPRTLEMHRIDRWIGYTKLPVDVNECVNVSIHGALLWSGIVATHITCFWDMLWIYLDSYKD